MFRGIQKCRCAEIAISSHPWSGRTVSHGSISQYLAAAGVDWSQHVETDARLLKRNSQPLRGVSGKLRKATGWAPTVIFIEPGARLVHEAEAMSQIGLAA
jgi:hypothetical protein